MARTPRPFWPMLAAAALTFAAWAPSLSGGLAKDDFSNFAANPVMRRPDLWPRLLFDKRAATVDAELANVYRPLSSLTYAALTAAGGGARPFLFHLLGVLAHAACAALVLLLGRELTGSWAPAAAGTALFALHPAQAEAVSYASAAVPGTLSLLCSLLALRAHAAGRRGAALALFCGAVLFKEGALALPAALAAYDWCVGQRPARDTGRRAAPFFAAAAALFVLRALVLGAATDSGLHGGTLSGQAAFAAAGFWTHLACALWPFGQRACYSLDAWPRPALGAGAALACAAAAAAGIRRRALWTFPLAFALTALLPVSNIIPVATLAADRYLYGPLAGLGWLVAAALARRPRAAVAFAAALGLLLPRALERQHDWASNFTADLSAAQDAPRDACGPALLAVDYYNWGDLARSRRALDEALAREPSPPLRSFVLKVRALVDRVR